MDDRIQSDADAKERQQLVTDEVIDNEDQHQGGRVADKLDIGETDQPGQQPPGPGPERESAESPRERGKEGFSWMDGMDGLAGGAPAHRHLHHQTPQLTLLHLETDEVGL